MNTRLLKIFSQEKINTFHVSMYDGCILEIKATNMIGVLQFFLDEFSESYAMEDILKIEKI